MLSQPNTIQAMHAKTVIKFASLFVTVAILGGCASAYFDTLERFGIEKREVLVDRIEEAKDAQENTKEQFRSALEEFSAVTQFEGGDLEALYDRLKKELDRSESAAKEVSTRIDKIQEVAGLLFKEWEEELSQYSSDSLRRQSEQQLYETQERYETLISVMQKAEARMDPVLASFRDQVLYLKHNLNAQAVASLGRQVGEIQDDVETLIREMEAAIEEASAFIADFKPAA